MIHAVVIALVVAAAPVEETLVPFKMPPVKLSVPETFEHSQDGTTHRFTTRDGEAYFEVDTGKVQTAGMTGDVCLGKVTKALGGKFTKAKFGGEAGAKKSFTDKDSSKKEFTTLLYVGCDGQTTFSLSFHVPKAKKTSYEPLATKIAESIQYQKGE